MGGSDGFAIIDAWYNNRVQKHYTPEFAQELGSMLEKRGVGQEICRGELSSEAMAQDSEHFYTLMHELLRVKGTASGIQTALRDELLGAASQLEVFASKAATTGAEAAFRTAFFDVDDYTDWCEGALRHLRLSLRSCESDLDGMLSHMQLYAPRLNAHVLKGAGYERKPMLLLAAPREAYAAR